jgi:hypothetical protein
MSIPNVLPSDHIGKLPATNIEVIKFFVGNGIDPNIFNISSAVSFECFLTLADAGYKLEKQTIHNIFLNGNSQLWKGESKIEFVEYLLNNADLCKKFEIYKHILSWVYFWVISTDDETITILLKTIVENYPLVKAGAVTAVAFYKYSDILEPAYSFSSQEFAHIYVNHAQFQGQDDWMIENMSRFCNPEDYLTRAIFIKVFQSDNVRCLEKFINYGFVPRLEDYPKNIRPMHVASFNYLKSINLWDGEMFDWDKRTYHAKYHKITLRKWMIENGCPGDIIKTL